MRVQPLRRLPAGHTPADLAAAPMLVLNRKDELQHRFLRGVTRRQVTSTVHYVPSAWGFVEDYAHAPHVPGYVIYMLFWGAYAIVTPFVRTTR